MKKRVLILFCFFLSCSVALAADHSAAPVDAANSPASEASIKELMELGKVRTMLDSIWAQMDGLMKQAMQQATEGKPVSVKVQKHIDKLETDLMNAVKEELSWEKLEPLYLRVYQKSLTQSEVDGMIAFYKTPAGQAVITKLPLVLQNTFAEVKEMMGPMMQRIERMQQDVMAEVKAEKAEKGKKG
jgi:uncharacterized protein